MAWTLQLFLAEDKQLLRQRLLSRLDSRLCLVEEESRLRRPSLSSLLLLSFNLRLHQRRFRRSREQVVEWKLL